MRGGARVPERVQPPALEQACNRQCTWCWGCAGGWGPAVKLSNRQCTVLLKRPTAPKRVAADLVRAAADDAHEAVLPRYLACRHDRVGFLSTSAPLPRLILLITRSPMAETRRSSLMQLASYTLAARCTSSCSPPRRGPWH